MHCYPTRRERNCEIIESFLKNEKKSSLELRLYQSEIRWLLSHYSIDIKAGNRYNDTELWFCTIQKK